MFHYQVFDITIRSTMELPELLPADTMAPDLVISEEPVPDSFSDGALRSGSMYDDELSYSSTADRLLLRVNQVGKFLIHRSGRLTIERVPGLHDESLRAYLLGLGLGFWLPWQGRFAFHASAVHTDRGAVLFMGPSGSGKSTTAAKFLDQGFRLLADDVSLVRFDAAGVPWVYPAFPQLKLWDDAADELGIAPEKLSPLSPDFNKYKLRVNIGFLEEPRPLHRIYLLSPDTSAVPEVHPMRGMEKIRALLRHTYRRYAIDILSLQESHFGFCSRIASGTSIRQAKRPGGKFLLDELFLLIMEDLECKPRSSPYSAERP